MNDRINKMNEEAVAKGRSASGLETTRPLADDIRTQDAATASVLIGVQGAIIDLQKRMADQEKQAAEIKERIRKVC